MLESWILIFDLYFCFAFPSYNLQNLRERSTLSSNVSTSFQLMGMGTIMLHRRQLLLHMHISYSPTDKDMSRSRARHQLGLRPITRQLLELLEATVFLFLHPHSSSSSSSSHRFRTKLLRHTSAAVPILWPNPPPPCPHLITLPSLPTKPTNNKCQGHSPSSTAHNSPSTQTRMHLLTEAEILLTPLLRHNHKSNASINLRPSITPHKHWDRLETMDSLQLLK